MFSKARHGGGEDQTSSAETQMQAEKLDALLGLLLSAGYFRARAPGLEPFDKVLLVKAAACLGVCTAPCFATGDWRHVQEDVSDWKREKPNAVHHATIAQPYWRARD